MVFIITSGPKKEGMTDEYPRSPREATHRFHEFRYYALLLLILFPVYLEYFRILDTTTYTYDSSSKSWWLLGMFQENYSFSLYQSPSSWLFGLHLVVLTYLVIIVFAFIQYYRSRNEDTYRLELLHMVILVIMLPFFIPLTGSLFQSCADSGCSTGRFTTIFYWIYAFLSWRVLLVLREMR